MKVPYGTAFQCAMPRCKQPLYRLSTDWQNEVLNSRVCHMAARSEGGPRWDAQMIEDENRSTGNLILMCISHASEIDDKSRLAEFPTETLKQWK